MSENPGKCGVPDHVTGLKRQGLCQWPRGHVITWSMHDSVPGLDLMRCAELWDSAAGVWSGVCDVAWRQLEMHRAADVVVRSASLGQSILAQAVLPCPVASNLWQEFNRDLRWSPDQYYGVAVHEIGHSLGWGHAPGTDCVMYPAFLGVTEPCAWDIDQAVSRYGAPQGGGGEWSGSVCDWIEVVIRVLEGVCEDVRKNS